MIKTMDGWMNASLVNVSGFCVLAFDEFFSTLGFLVL